MAGESFNEVYRQLALTGVGISPTPDKNPEGSPRSIKAATSATPNAPITKAPSLPAGEAIDPRTGEMINTRTGKPVQIGPPAPPVTGTPKTATPVAAKPATAGSVTNRQSVVESEPREDNDSTMTQVATQVANLNKAIVSQQATNATQAKEIASLQNQYAVSQAAQLAAQSQVGSSAVTGSGTGGVTSGTSTGLLGGLLSGGISRYVLVAGIGIGGYFLLKSQGYIGGAKNPGQKVMESE